MAEGDRINKSGLMNDKGPSVERRRAFVFG
jgi:hypothetical protein